jgi:hypothetical protein
MPTVEDRALGLYEGSLAGPTLIALRALLGSTELDDVAVIDLAVIWTGLVPAEGTRRNQSSVFHLCLSTV